jgi:hypothetical protein
MDTLNAPQFIFDGDCSVVRRAVLPMRGARRAAICVGWPAGFTGVLSVEHNSMGNAVASAPLGVTISKQPAGTADGTIITGIVTDAPYIILVVTPTTGGTGIYLLDENQNPGSKPVLSLKA